MLLAQCKDAVCTITGNIGVLAKRYLMESVKFSRI